MSGPFRIQYSGLGIEVGVSAAESALAILHTIGSSGRYKVHRLMSKLNFKDVVWLILPEAKLKL